MTDELETLGAPPVERATLNGSAGLLDAIHQRWLERTEDGDSQLIVSRLTRQVESGEPDEESYLMLLDGYIARIGKEHVAATLSEADVYRAGKQALQIYFESAAQTKSKRVRLWDILGVIEDAYEPDKLAEISQANESAPDSPDNSPLQPVPVPRVQRVRRQYKRNPEPVPRSKSQHLEALGIANQSNTDQAEIRAGLRQGRISLSEALSSPVTERMTIADLLIRVPKLGKTKLRNALKAIGAAGASEIGALDSAQISQLIEMFPPEKHQPSHQKSTVSREQSMASLKQANEARRYRAGLKKKMAAGETTVEELLDDPIGAGMLLSDVLLKLPTRVGAKPERVCSRALRDAVLRDTGLPESKSLNQLTKRQQKILLDQLSARYKEETGTYTYRLVLAP